GDQILRGGYGPRPERGSLRVVPALPGTDPRGVRPARRRVRASSHGRDAAAPAAATADAGAGPPPPPPGAAPEERPPPGPGEDRAAGPLSPTRRGPGRVATMTVLQFYGEPAPGLGTAGEVLPGRLLVIEGTDGVGRSTQIALLKEWLEGRGYAVVGSGLRRS